MRRFAVLATVLAAAAALPASASATAPTSEPIDFVESATIDCSQFDPAWTFNDDFVDFYTGTATTYYDEAGNPVREIDHVYHRSNDVNSVTGFTLHEHNHVTAIVDFVAGTLTLNGSLGIMQRPGVGEVIHTTGHKVIDLATGEPIALRGPEMSDDEDFCRAVAP